MGSLENGAAAAAAAGSFKRGPPLLPLRAPSAGARRARARSRLARLLLAEKVDYLQWIVTAAAFFFVAIVFVAFLPSSSVVEQRPALLLPSSRAGGGLRDAIGDPLTLGGELGASEEAVVAFEPTRLRERWAKERREEAEGLAQLGTPVRRLGARKPRLAMVSTILMSRAGAGFVRSGVLSGLVSDLVVVHVPSLCRCLGTCLLAQCSFRWLASPRCWRPWATK